MISDDDYRQVQAALDVVCSIVVGLEDDMLAAFIERGDRAMGIGPILHPTAFRDGADMLELVLSNARTIRAARTAIVAARARVRRDMEGVSA